MWFDQHTKQKQKSRKIPEKFLNNPGIKNKGKSRPEKSRDPGIWQNPVPENPGIENLDPARAWWWQAWTLIFFLKSFDMVSVQAGKAIVVTTGIL